MTADVTVQASRARSGSLAPQDPANPRARPTRAPVLQERQAREAKEGGLQTYKQQISYGVHVSVMMGTFYAAGHYGAQAVSARPVNVRPWVAAALVAAQARHRRGLRVQQAIAGLAGMMAALLLETWLFIIRTNFEPHPALKKRPVPPRQATAAPTSSAPRAGASGAAPPGAEAKKTR